MPELRYEDQQEMDTWKDDALETEGVCRDCPLIKDCRRRVARGLWVGCEQPDGDDFARMRLWSPDPDLRRLLSRRLTGGSKITSLHLSGGGNG
ncbi:MAG: hypothetical protein OEY93_00530 [Anaerolineae bacterium]|nr:hypothetical protein [Anaerolineae bacterium]